MLAFVIAFIVWIGKRVRAAKKKEDKVVDPAEEMANEKSMTELLPIRYYDYQYECYRMQKDQCMDILKIRDKDLLSMSPEEVQFDCMIYTKFYKIYAGDVKLISMNFPVNTSEQIIYLENKLETEQNPRRKKWLRIKLNEELNLQKNGSAREYYLMYFSEDEKIHEKNKSSILQTLKNGQESLVMEMDFNKKNQIIEKLTNKNVVIGRER